MNVRKTITVSVAIAAKTIALRISGSCLRCMKKERTRPAFTVAISKAASVLSLPRFMPATVTVTAVSMISPIHTEI